MLDAIEDEFEKFEEQIFSGKPLRANIEGLYYVRQKLTTLQHAVVPLLEAVGKLYGGRVPQVCSGLQDYYRDVYDHLVRISQTINSQRDTVTTAIQVNVAMITFGETEVTKRLAAWGALIAVPTFIASLYGMNFKHMPELDWVLRLSRRGRRHGADQYSSFPALPQGGLALALVAAPRLARAQRRKDRGRSCRISAQESTGPASIPLRKAAWRSCRFAPEQAQGNARRPPSRARTGADAGPARTRHGCPAFPLPGRRPRSDLLFARASAAARAGES